MLIPLIALLPAALAEDPPEPSFGADVSVAIAPGAVLGEWPVAGIGGAWTARYDAFIQDRETPGPRVGLSIFAGGSLWPLQEKSEVGDDGAVETGPLEYLHYGALAVIRYDPALRWGGTFGVGFSRLDLEDWYGGVQTVPVLVVEGGARRLLGRDGPWFLDLGVRTGWGSARGADVGEVGPDWTDWWMVQGLVGVGVHVR